MFIPNNGFKRMEERWEKKKSKKNKEKKIMKETDANGRQRHTT